MDGENGRVFTYESLEVFYRSDERRRQSVEVDSGVWWRESQPWPTYRVTWILATGELYAVAAVPGRDRVELLGHFGARGAVEEALRGWADRCGELGSLGWVRRRARGITRSAAPPGR
jgi:hypothetical protein